MLTVWTLTLMPIASAHHVDSFTACARYGSGGGCRHRVGGPWGELVILRWRVKPSHSRLRADVWRRLPNSGGVWRKIDDVVIHPRGKMRWEWRAEQSDAADASYGFQFRIPAHRRSNKVRVWVVEEI
jgi:hypothetical protein